MTRVKKLYIGLGDRTNPTPSGAGTIYIDDIWIIEGIAPAGQSAFRMAASGLKASGLPSADADRLPRCPKASQSVP